MQKDFESIIERKIHGNLNEAQGVWHMGQRDINWVRISKSAKNAGFTLEHIGDLLNAVTHHTFRSIVDKVQITLFIDEKDVKAKMRGGARRPTRSATSASAT